MSYINCYSHITGETLQCGLIEVGLKHKDTQANYGTTIQYAYQYWNTAPESHSSQTIIENNNKWHYGISGSEMITFASVTGRGSQSTGPSGELVSTYGYVYGGARQPISNGVFDIEDMNMGENIIDLFDTDTVAVKLYCYKGKLSDESSYDPSTPARFFDAGGEEIAEQTVLIDVGIRMYLKSNNNEICRYSFTQNSVTSVKPLKFSIATELFDIKQMVPSYYAEEEYNYRYNGYYDINSFSGNKIAGPNGEVTTPVDDAIIPAFELIMADGYVAPMQSNTYYRTTLYGVGLQPINDATLREITNELFSGFVLFEASTFPHDFIQFVSPQGNYGLLNYSVKLGYYTNEVYNQDHGYRYKQNGQWIEDSTIQGNVKFDISGETMLASPLLLPLTDNNHEYMTYNQSGVFIPLTGVINGGEPEPPEPPEPGPEEADDPDTEYNPDESDGYDEYDYPNSDIVDGLEASNLPYGTSYNNFVFGHFKISNINPQTQYDRYAAYQMIMDCTNTTLLEWVAQKFESHNFQLSDFVCRVYETPFSYEDIFDSTHPVLSGAPSYGYMGPVTRGVLYTQQSTDPVWGPGSGYKWDSDNVHWFNFSPYRYFPIDLGTQNIEKVFDNYLDYKCQYTLNLPYGGPQVNIDPNYLFGDSNKGTIKIKGVFDIDTGTLYIKVLVGPYSQNEEYLQLYYQTIVNVASDKVVSAVDAGVRTESSVKMGLAIAGAIGSIALGIGRGKFGDGDPYAGNSRGAYERRSRSLTEAFREDRQETLERAMRAKERIREAQEKAINAANERIRINADRAERHKRQVDENHAYNDQRDAMRYAYSEHLATTKHNLNAEHQAKADHNAAVRAQTEHMAEARRFANVLATTFQSDPEKANQMAEDFLSKMKERYEGGD